MPKKIPVWTTVARSYGSLKEGLSDLAKMGQRWAIGAGLVYYGTGYQWEISWPFLLPYARELPFIKPALPIVTYLGLRWLLISLFQWLALRLFVRQAWLWPLATTGAACVWGLIAVLFSYGKSQNDFLLMNILGAGILIGTAQGLCLVYFNTKGSSTTNE